MAKKITTAWFCSSCGNESPKWMGRCPACGEWNTMVEEPKAARSGSGAATGSVSRDRGLLGVAQAEPIQLRNIDLSNEERLKLGNAEVERILGGGLVAGSMVLIGGEPGIGKSTLALQIPLHCKELKTLYVSGEESPRQIKLRSNRLCEGGEDRSNCMILCETLLENIIKQAQQQKPELLVVDSIQTIYSDAMDSSAASVSQVRECATALLRFAKESGTPVILIGHITKDGSIAGPKVLEHIVDVVLQFEGDTRHSYRMLRSIKNRFGSTAELAIFEMTDRGLREITNPSQILTPMHGEHLSGVAVGSMIDGTRPFMIEIQALVSTAAYGMPQRSATGFDSRRLNMLMAVLAKRDGFQLSAKDVFLNVAGGMKVNDPSCDLAVVAAILSSTFDSEVSQKCCFAGEIGLSGEIRPVGNLERRTAEAARLGYEAIYVSKYSSPEALATKASISVIPIGTIGDLLRSLFK